MVMYCIFVVLFNWQNINTMKKYLFVFFLLSVLAVNGQSSPLDKDFKSRFDNINRQWIKAKKKSDTIRIKKDIEEIIENADEIDLRVMHITAKRCLAVWHERMRDSLTADSIYSKVLDDCKLFKEPKEYAKTLDSMSRFYQRLNNYRKAIDYGIQYDSLSKDLKLEGKGLLFGNMGGAYRQIHQLDSALLWRKRAITAFTEENDSLSAARQMSYAIYDYALMTSGSVVCQNPKYAHEMAINAQLLLNRILQITQNVKKSQKEEALFIKASAYHNYKCIVSIETANRLSRWYNNFDTAIAYCQLAIEAYKKTDNYTLNAPSLAWDNAIFFLQKAIITADETSKDSLKSNTLECEAWYYDARYKIRKAHYYLGDSSIYWAKKGLEIVKKSKNTEGVSDVEQSLWHHLALTYYAMDSLDKAAFYWGLINDTYTRGNFNSTYAWNIKKVLEEKKDYNAVIELGQKILAVDNMAYSIISEGYWKKGQVQEAINYMKTFTDKSEIGFNKERNLAYAWGKLSYYYDHKRINVCVCDSIVDKAINASKNALDFVKEPYNDTLFLRLTNLYSVKNTTDSSIHYFKEWVRIRRSIKRENDSIEYKRLLDLDLYSKFTECFIEHKYDSVIYWGERILQLGEINFDKQYREELYGKLVFASFLTKRDDLKLLYSKKTRNLLWEYQDIYKLTSYVQLAIDSNIIAKDEIELYVNNVQKDSSTLQLLAEGFEFLGKFDSAAIYYEQVFQTTPTKWLEWKEGSRFKAIECYHKSKQYNKVIELSKAVSDTIVATKKAMRYVWKAGELGCERYLFIFSWVKQIIYDLAVMKDTNPVLYLQYYENAKYSNTDALIFTANAYFESGQDDLGVLYTKYTDDRYIFNSTKKHFLDSLLAINHYKSGLYHLKKGNYDNAVHSLESSEREDIGINGLNQARLDAEYKRAWGYQTDIVYWKKVNQWLDKVGNEDPENLWKRFEAKYFSNSFINKEEATQLLNKIRNHYHQKGYYTKHPYFFALDIFDEDFKKLQVSEEEKRKEQNARLEAEKKSILFKYERDLKDSTIAYQTSKSLTDRLQTVELEGKNLKLRELSIKLEEENYKTKLLLIFTIIASLVASISYIKARNRRKIEQITNTKLKIANEEVKKQASELELRNIELEDKNLIIKNQFEEIKHRIGNNLNNLMSLITKQRDRTENKDAKKVLETTGIMLSNIYIVQDMLYDSKSDNSDTINMADYISKLSEIILLNYKELDINLKVEVDNDIRLIFLYARSVGSIVAELILNACKYAFLKERTPNIYVTLKNHNKDFYRLTVQDNGCGLDLDKYEDRKKVSMGSEIVRINATNLKRSQVIHIQGLENKGVGFEIIFPKIKK